MSRYYDTYARDVTICVNVFLIIGMLAKVIEEFLQS